MIARKLLALALVVAGGVFGMAANEAQGQTALPSGFKIRLLPGYAHEPQQGFDSIVGRLKAEKGLEIQYELSGVIPPGQPRFGGSYSNRAKDTPEAERLWYKEQTVNGWKIHVAHRKDQYLIVSAEAPVSTMGFTFSALAKNPGDVADVLLMVSSLEDPKQAAGK